MKKYPKIVQADARGQIVIPKDIRQELKIDESTGFFVYSIDDEGILLKIIKPSDLGADKSIKALSSKADIIGVKKSNLEKAKRGYKKTKEGKLEVI